jgi:hypothetical protein
VTESDPTNVSWVHDAANGFMNYGKYPSHACVKEKRLVILDQELIELEISHRDVDRDAKHVRRNFSSGCHEQTRERLGGYDERSE